MYTEGRISNAHSWVLDEVMRTSLTMVLVRISILLSLKVDSVYSISCLLNIGSTEGRASTSVILTLPASSGYHIFKSSSKKSCNSPLWRC